MISGHLFSGTLRTRMAVVISALLLAITVATAGLFVQHVARVELDAQSELGYHLLRLAESGARQFQAAHDIARDPAPLATLTEVSRHPAVARLAVTDETGRQLYVFERADDHGNRLTRLFLSHDPTARRLTAEFRDDRSRAGHIELTLADAPIVGDIRAMLRDGLLFLGIALPLLAAVVYLFIRRLTAPLQPLTAMARELSRGNDVPAARTIRSGSRDIRELSQAFVTGSENMRHYIQSLEETRGLLEHSENRLRKLIDGMQEILFELDPDGDLSFLNPAWERVTGHAVGESLGRKLTAFLPSPDTAALFAAERLPTLHERRHEVALRAATGKTLWVQLDAQAQYDGNGQFTGVIGTLSDVTASVELNDQLTRYQEDLYQLSISDPLTGLYNRRHFDAQLESILADQLPRDLPVCLLIVNVDGFKAINDTYGHPAGDESLRTLAGLLTDAARGGDYLARLASDEFAVILRDTDIGEATRIAHQLHDRISNARVTLPVGHVQLQCSIGVAAAPAHGRSAQELVSAADVALYHAKRRGPNRVEVLAPDISEALLSIFGQGFRLRHALEQGNLMPAFQPICEIESGQPIAYEALARMHHDGSLIKAGDFIGVAEELGLTRDIDLHIIEQSLRLAPQCYELFLNLDPSSFHDRGFACELGELIGPACRAGRAVTIEITERENVALSDALVADIRYLRGLGCRLALDDFGSGYSTYHFLNVFRPEYLKIDGTYVRRMLDHESDHKIVAHIHELATSFGAQTIAESVENEATRQALRRLGIRNAQGLHLGSPRLCGDAEARLDTRRPAH